MAHEKLNGAAHGGPEKAEDLRHEMEQQLVQGVAACCQAVKIAKATKKWDTPLVRDALQRMAGTKRGS